MGNTFPYFEKLFLCTPNTTPTIQIPGVHDLLRHYLITTQLNHYHILHKALYVPVFCPEHLYPLDVHAMFNYSWLIRDGCVSCVDLNARTTLPYVRHPTLPKDFIYAGFFNPFKMEAKIPSGVCWLVRQYPFYAQWLVSTMLLPHVNLEMLDSHTVIFSFVHNAPYLYIIYIL